MKLYPTKLAAIIVLLLSFTISTKADTPDNISVTVLKTGPFSTLMKALLAAGLTDALQRSGPFTLFAPTDKAFAKLDKAKPGAVAALLKPKDKAALAAIINYHVLSVKLLDADLQKSKDGVAIKTLNGKSIVVHTKNGLAVDNAKIIGMDVLCSNGVIHAIDTVLFPK